MGAAQHGRAEGCQPETVEGEMFGREEELKELIVLQPGKTYVGDLQEATNKLIVQRRKK